jgi:uncharacterized membrane protein YhhN
MATNMAAGGSIGALRRDPMFLGLWIVWAAALAGAMVLGNLDRHGATPATALRMGSSVVLCIVAWAAYARWQARPVARFALCLAVGMTLGTIGDFFNAGLLEFVPVLKGTLGGIVAFGLGHIAYIAGCLDLRKRAGLNRWLTMIMAIDFWQMFGLVAWYLVAYLGDKNRDLLYPALGYTLLLAGTAGIATGLALQERRLTMLAVGAALFLLSDLILAVGMFRESVSHSTEWVWLTYGPGQMLIVFSVLSAYAVLESRSSDQ